MWPFSRAKPPAGPAVGNDVFWLHDAPRIHGVIAAASRAISSGSHVRLVTHAPSRVAPLADAAARAGVPLDAIPAPITPHELAARMRAQPAEAGACLFLALASNLKPPNLKPSSPAAEPSPPAAILVLVSDRHPLRTRDDALTSFAAALASARVEFHVCVDDPLLELFAGPATRQLMRTLGMQDDDSLSNRALTRSVARAQHKVAQKCPDHANVDSWLAEQLRN